MRTLAVVPARAGSRGLPGKNARPFLGVSLLERAIRIGQETCDDLVVTTDADELVSIAIKCGAYVHRRPAELATDEAPMLPVVQDAIRGREGDVIVLLQPTQPLREALDVREALRVLRVSGCDSVASVRRIPEAYLPDRALILVGYEYLEPATRYGRTCERRQDARPAYVRCGTVYAAKRWVVEEGSLYGPQCRPLILPGDALSIDTLEDFERLEALARRSHGEETTQAEAATGVLGR